MTRDSGNRQLHAISLCNMTLYDLTPLHFEDSGRQELVDLPRVELNVEFQTKVSQVDEVSTRNHSHPEMEGASTSTPLVRNSSGHECNSFGFSR